MTIDGKATDPRSATGDSQDRITEGDNEKRSALFGSWLESCLLQGDSTCDLGQNQTSYINDSVALRLKDEACSHFASLSPSAQSKFSSLSSSSSSKNLETSSREASVSPPFSSTDTDGVSQTRTLVPDEALVLLLSLLKPVIYPARNSFESDGSGRNRTLLAKVRALSCLTGAIEGSRTLTLGMRQVLGHFLAALCGPVKDEELEQFQQKSEPDAVDYVDAHNLTPEEVTQKLQSMEKVHQQNKQTVTKEIIECNQDDVRDASIMSLTALLRSSLEIFVTRQTQQKESSSFPQDEALVAVHRSITLRLDIAMLGVRHRCGMENKNPAAGENIDFSRPGDGYELMDIASPEDGSFSNYDLEDGLSQLPRVKRSLCFHLLNGSLEGLRKDIEHCNKLKALSSLSNEGGEVRALNDAIPFRVHKSMASFSSFVSCCLHGETDPRCILQLFRLLNKVQQIMLPLFGEVSRGHPSKSCNTVADVVADDIDIDTSELISDNPIRQEIQDVQNAIPFPSVELFDAVAPYYPLHFTPPKNDPHGITRASLENALMAVLCEQGVFYDIENGNGKNQEEETMAMLAASMFLERLDPPKSSTMDDGYEPPSDASDTVDDKLAALRDLTTLILTPPTSRDLTSLSPDVTNYPDVLVSGRTVSRNLLLISPSFLSDLSASLARVHEEAVSFNVTSTSKSGDNSKDNVSAQKTLASAIRKFASSLSHSLEAIATINSTIKTTRLWEAFVLNVVRRLSPALASAPQGTHGRATTAYLASLAAEGGQLTLKVILEGCLPSLLGVLPAFDKVGNSNDETSLSARALNHKNRDDEKMVAAIRGIGAFVSSCRVALEQLERDKGVHVHPHPLTPFISNIISKFCCFMCGSSAMKQTEPFESSHEEEISWEQVTPISVAIAGALESVVTTMDLLVLEVNDMILMEKMVSFIAKAVLDDREINNTAANISAVRQWKAACARTLGGVIALGLSQKKSKREEIDKICVLAQFLLPQLITSATTVVNSHTHRNDWIALAEACANGDFDVSRQITSALLSNLISALNPAQFHIGNSYQQKISMPALALSYLIRCGGSNVGAAFHSLSFPDVAPMDVVKALCKPVENDVMEGNVANGQKIVMRKLKVGISQLQLPSSRAKEQEEANALIQRAYAILPHLTPAYECASSKASCKDLVHFVGQILPPLSEWDEVKLCVSFPLLAAVLKSTNDLWESLDEDTFENLKSMTPYLTQYSICPDHESLSRSAAASCLFSILFHSDNEASGVHEVNKLLHEVISPALTTALKSLRIDMSEVPTPKATCAVGGLYSNFSQVADTINFMGILGSAAACKGGCFSQIADAISCFLVELSCNGSANFPFTRTLVTLIEPAEKGRQHPIQDPSSYAHIIPASAFGNILSVDNGGPFWKQRMAHKSLPILMKAIQANEQTQNPPALGILMIVCHILCSLPVSLLGESTVTQLFPTIVAGLVYYSKNIKLLTQPEKIPFRPPDILSLILASLLKILAFFPDNFMKFLGIIIPSILLLCASTESEAHIPKLLLALQCLESITKHAQLRDVMLREKDQVVSILSVVVDHPSMTVRQAVVQVRNVWYTI